MAYQSAVAVLEELTEAPALLMVATHQPLALLPLVEVVEDKSAASRAPLEAVAEVVYTLAPEVLDRRAVTEAQEARQDRIREEAVVVPPVQAVTEVSVAPARAAVRAHGSMAYHIAEAVQAERTPHTRQAVVLDTVVAATLAVPKAVTELQVLLSVATR